MASLFFVCAAKKERKKTNIEIRCAACTRQEVWNLFTQEVLKESSLSKEEIKERFDRNSSAVDMNYYEEKKLCIWVERIKFLDMNAAYAMVTKIFPEQQNYWYAKFREKKWFNSL